MAKPASASRRRQKMFCRPCLYGPGCRPRVPRSLPPVLAPPYGHGCCIYREHHDLHDGERLKTLTVDETSFPIAKPRYALLIAYKAFADLAGKGSLFVITI